MNIDDIPINLTPLQQRLVDAANEIAEVRPDAVEYMHSVLCQVGLPRSKTDSRFFERTNGSTSVAIEAGRLMKAGKWVEMPLPYGAKPRLALLHISSEAVRTQSAHIEIGSSIREFLSMLGLPSNGHAFTEMRRQMESLAACRMLFGMSTATKDITIETKPIEVFEAWLQVDGGQRAMWPGSLELSPRFLETLLERAVPLDPRAIHGLQKSALALDIYTWLAHRLCRVRTDTGVKLSWRNLREQFGQEYANPKDFKKKFLPALFKVRSVYNDARIEIEAGGIRLFPSPPPVPKTQVLVGFKR